MLSSEIRLLKDLEEFKACEGVERAVWGGLSVSAETMLVTQKFGGAVLGTFVKKELAGFIYAFLARRNGKIIHWSHLMAILPPFRGQGFGRRLKLAHRDFALRQGIKCICWTYDPLQSRNASLNLNRLGARVEEYLVNCYGRFPSHIEQGLQSDRFVVNWRIASKSVERCLTEKKSGIEIPEMPGANLTGSNEQGFLVNRKIVLDHKAPRLLVEIPPNTDAMRTENLALAKRWRVQTRKIFLHYLANGYRVDSFLKENRGTVRPRCFYVLRRKRT